MADEIIDDSPGRRDEPFVRWSTLVSYPPGHHARMAGKTIRLRVDGDRSLAETRYAIHTENGAAAQLQRQQWTPGPWVPVDGPTVTPTTYTISRLPEDHEAYLSFAITVEYRGDGNWRVSRGRGRVLFTTGEWLPDSVPDDVGEADWWAMCRYTRDRALELAVAAVDTIKVNGRTVAEVS